MSDGNVLSSTPDFNLHRDEVTVADAATVLQEEARGINCHDYEGLLANLMCDVGAAGHQVTFEAMFWSPMAGKYVSEATPLTWTVPHSTAVAVYIPARGRKCFIAVTAIVGAGRKGSAEVAGFNVINRFD